MRALIKRVLWTGFVLATLLVAGMVWWVNSPMRLPAGVQSVDLSIEPGARPAAIAQAVANAGVQVQPQLLMWWFRLSGQARHLRAGGYEIMAGATPASVTRMLARGEESLRTLSLIEGWNWSQVRQTLSRASDLKHDSQDLRGCRCCKGCRSTGRPCANCHQMPDPDRKSRLDRSANACRCASGC